MDKMKKIKQMNKTTAIILVVILLVGGFFLFRRSSPAPEVEVPTDTSNLEEDNSQVIETPAPAPTQPNPAIALEGKSFRLVSFNGAVIPEDVNYILEFEEGRLGVKFCNHMGGDYTIVNGFIKVSEFVSTLMYCSSPENVMGLENLFGSLVNKGAAFSLVGDSLVLADTRDTMTFKVLE